MVWKFFARVAGFRASCSKPSPRRVGLGRRLRFYHPRLEFLEGRELPSASWLGFANDPQHTGLSAVVSQVMEGVRWQTPVDLNPQYSGNDLLIHYGSPLVTPSNTVIIPVKTGASGGFEVEAVHGTDGSLLWTQTTDYILPPHNWVPSYSPTLTPQNRLYFAGAGGTIYYIDSPDTPGPHTPTQITFYGLSNYNANPTVYNNSVFIDTPITADSQGDIFFGFRVTGSNPASLTSGIARIDANGNGSWVSGASAAGDSNIAVVPHNMAPALSNDQSTLYVAVRSGSTSYYGYLLGLDSITLATKYNSGILKDPRNNGANNAGLLDDGTASPMVGPDGDVYYGVMGSPYNGSRGWMLHFSGDLLTIKTPGAFGWDDTASVVPASIVPSYTGSSPYLLFTKYNNYAGVSDGGDGVNKIAILDPNATEVEPHPSSNGLLVMKEILTIAGPTPDPQFINSGYPNAVREWCINSAAVDPATKSVLANSEDGKVYRWDMTTNTLSQTVVLTPGIGEAYTCTLIGSDGTVYAINNATLFAVGKGPRLTINDFAQTSVDQGTINFTFTVSLGSPDGQTVTVQYTTADGTATAPGDYQATSGTLTFGPGVTSQTITVQVNADTTDEANETFSVNLSNAVDAVISRGQGTGTIVNDDPNPAMTIVDASLAEGAAKNATVNVRLLRASTNPISVQYATADGAATAGTDYTAVSGTLTFSPGQTSKNISVPILDDTTAEPDENFFINLSGPTNAVLVRSQATVTIVNDENSLSINNVQVTEGGIGGVTSADFTVSLSASASFPVTVNYATGNGTAKAGEDYAINNGTLTFAPGDATKTISVPVFGDTRYEPSETFFVSLSGAGSAIIAQGKGTGTILNNNPPPTVTINSVSQAEGSASTTPFVFTVNLSASADVTVTVPYSTADGTAIAGTDYTATSGTLTFSPGQTSKTISVLVNGDTDSAPDQTFFVNLGDPTNATLGNSQGTGTILNDNPDRLITIGNVTAIDGSSGTKNFSFTVKLSSASTQTVTVQYATADGTATVAEGDYLPAPGILTFLPGKTSQTITVKVNGNTDVEADENFFVNLSNPVNGRLVTSQAVGTILNDDLSLAINSISVTQPVAGTAQATFTVTLSAAASFPVTVQFATLNGSAMAGTDFVTDSGTLTFSPGQTSQTVNVVVPGESVNEAKETFQVKLSNSTNAIISQAIGTATVLNSVPVPSISINNVTMTEENSGPAAFTFTVSLSAPSGQAVTVQFATMDGTATAAENDYQAAGGALTFAPGQTSKTITILVYDELGATESPENFFVLLSNPVNAALSNNQGTGTILSND